MLLPQGIVHAIRHCASRLAGMCFFVACTPQGQVCGMGCGHVQEEECEDSCADLILVSLRIYACQQIKNSSFRWMY